MKRCRSLYIHVEQLVEHLMSMNKLAEQRNGTTSECTAFLEGFLAR